MVHLNLHGLFFLDKISAPSASYTDKILVFLTTVDSSKKSSNYSTGYGVSYSITLFLQFGKFHNVGYTAFNQHLFTRLLSSSKVPNLWCMLFRIINGGFSIVIKIHRSVTSQKKFPTVIPVLRIITRFLHCDHRLLRKHMSVVNKHIMAKKFEYNQSQFCNVCTASYTDIEVILNYQLRFIR